MGMDISSGVLADLDPLERTPPPLRSKSVSKKWTPGTNPLADTEPRGSKSSNGFYGKRLNCKLETNLLNNAALESKKKVYVPRS